MLIHGNEGEGGSKPIIDTNDRRTNLSLHSCMIHWRLKKPIKLTCLVDYICVNREVSEARDIKGILVLKQSSTIFVGSDGHTGSELMPAMAPKISTMEDRIMSDVM